MTSRVTKLRIKAGTALEDVRSKIRASVPYYAQDRFMAPDIDWATRWVGSGSAYTRVGSLVPSFARAS